MTFKESNKISKHDYYYKKDAAYNFGTMAQLYPHLLVICKNCGYPRGQHYSGICPVEENGKPKPKMEPVFDPVLNHNIKVI